MSNCSLFIPAGGESYCVYYTSSGNTYYTTVLNTDSTVDFSSTFRFTCYVRNIFSENLKSKKSIHFFKCACPLYCFLMVNIIRLLRHLDQQCTLVIAKVSVRGLSPPQLSSPMGRAHWCSPPTVCVKKSMIHSYVYIIMIFE